MASDTHTPTDAPLIVGIDAGTSRIRALVFTTEGTLISQGSAPTPTHHPQTGWAEHDAEALWTATVDALRLALAPLQNTKQIIGVGVASVGEAGVALDAHGKAQLPVIAWFDQRTEQQSLDLKENLGSDALFKTTGLSLDQNFGLCKLLWLKQHHAQEFSRIEHWLNIADYLCWRLCNEMATDYSLASRTLALNIHNREWSQSLIDAAGLSPSLFAPLRASGARLGSVSTAAATITGLPKHCAVAVGGHDHILGALAAGGWNAGTVLDSLGTAEAILMAMPQPLQDPDLLEQGYSQGAMEVDQPLHYVVGGVSTSGACVEWFRQLFGNEADHADLIGEAKLVPAGCHGVGFLPHMRIASPPFRRSSARGVYYGLSPESDRSVLYRALLEGLAFDAASVVANLTQLDGIPAIDQIRAIGGNTRNELLMQIKADVFQRTVTVVDMSEATSLGAALLGGLAAGVYTTLEQAQSELRINATGIDPGTENRAAYQVGFERFRRLPDAMSAIYETNS